jgi:hypothetical protein
MSELIKLYDLSGEAFELSIANAQDAEAHLGWSRNPPANPVAKIKDAAMVELDAETEAVNVAEVKAEEATPKKGRPSKSE